MRASTFLLLAASAAGIAALAVAADLAAPPLVALRDLAAWEAHAVAVEALVARASPAGAGAQVLALADASGRAAAFWGSAEPVEGAWVRAEGSVERMRGAWELRAWSVAVLQDARGPLGAAQAARLAPALVGREVAVLGALRWEGDRDPALAEAGASLALRAPAAALAGLAGARVLARGVLVFEAGEARYVLEAWEVAPP